MGKADSVGQMDRHSQQREHLAKALGMGKARCGQVEPKALVQGCD